MIVCIAVILINLSNIQWNTHDKEVLDRNKNFCYNKFENSKCMKKFIKFDDYRYGIICGGGKQ